MKRKCPTNTLRSRLNKDINIIKHKLKDDKQQNEMKREISAPVKETEEQNNTLPTE